MRLGGSRELESTEETMTYSVGGFCQVVKEQNVLQDELATRWKRDAGFIRQLNDAQSNGLLSTFDSDGRLLENLVMYTVRQHELL
jgi:hypothetical protein